MKRKIELGKYVAYMLANIAVVGYGLSLYQGKWWTLVIALIATKLGILIIWRISNDD